VDGARGGADLTRAIREIPAGVRVLPVPDQSRLLTDADLDAWRALGLALTCADLVGIMRGVLEQSVGYARERKQYGVPIGSFQAVQHLLAEAHTLMEGASSVALHPSWGVDDLGPEEARHAGRVAKAYCARAARTVCETAVQVYGGMGNTWDCIVHVYLRRALLSSRWFGDDAEQLRQLQRTRLGAAHGLS
jgi:alkylation response protein AidB-like acyl-CoA dehydrogenase